MTQHEHGDATAGTRIDLATPCDRTWDSLLGDDARRYCGDCRLHVHNLSAMTSAQIHELMSNAQGRVCGRYFQRADGTVITKDCGPERTTLRRRARRLRIAAATLFGLAGTFGLSACGGDGGGAGAGATPDGSAVGVDPAADQPIELLGEVCLPEDLQPVPAGDDTLEPVQAPPRELIGKIAPQTPPATTPPATQDPPTREQD